MPLIVNEYLVSYRVAGRFRRLDVLERAQHVEQTHRDDDREVRQQVSAADGGDQVADDGEWSVDGGRGGACANRRDPGDPAQECPKRHSHDTAGKVSLEAHATEVGQHHDRQRGHPHDRMREGAEEEAERDEPQGDAREGREERRPRGCLADALGDEGTRKFDHAGRECRQQTRVPRDAHRVDRAGSFGQRLRR